MEGVGYLFLVVISPVIIDLLHDVNKMYRNLLPVALVLFIISSCTVKDSDVYWSGKILFNEEWEFIIDTAEYDSPDRLSREKGILSWEPVILPHTPRIEPLIVNDQWQGNCWYRKRFSADEKWSGKNVFIRFEGAMNVAELWVNGNKKLTHLGGYLPFVADITDDIREQDINTIHLKLNNEDNPVTGPKPLNILDFNMYGGLYRDVFLIVKNQVYITDEQYADKVAGGGIFVTYPYVSREQAVVSIKTNIINSGDQPAKLKVSQSLIYNDHIVSSCSAGLVIDPGLNKDIIQEMEVSEPLLWSTESPDLYTLETSVEHKGLVLDRNRMRIGIRAFEFRNNSLFINGEETFLRGVNCHQEYPYIGYALSNNAQFRDAVKIKEAGFDCIRLSHYPHSPAFMDACDELGIVTLDAIPGWQYFSEDVQFRNHVFRTARDMIRRDRNHPSVLAWEVSLNESWMPDSFIDTLVMITHEEYPGKNCYAAGWQEHGYDIYIQARQHRIGHPRHYPDKPYLVSEYGDWEYFALNAGLNQNAWGGLLEEERTSRQLLGSGEIRLLQQALNIQEAHNDNFHTPAIADCYWVMFDYNRGYADDIESSGVMSIFRLPKFSYHFFRSQRNPGEMVCGKPFKPVVFIASYCDESSATDISIFSNCETIELLYNGESLGRSEPLINRISDKLIHPPLIFDEAYSGQGSYTAIGYISGEEVARHKIITAGKPSQILLEADLSGKDLEQGCKDVVFVHAVIKDCNDQIVTKYDTDVIFELSGNGTIIGPDVILPEAGRATVLIMAGNEAGDITILASTADMVSDPFLVRVID